MSDRGGEDLDGKPLTAVPAPAAIPAPLVDLVLDSLPSPHSRRAYHRALGEFFSWYPSNAPGEGFTRATVQRYRSHLAERELSAASINLALAAVRKLAAEAAANSFVDPGTAAAIASVPGARSSGTRSGNWLSLEQTRRLLAVPDPASIKGLRDRVLLGFLVGCGLRRGELAGLEFSDVAQREGRWAIVDLVGKHGRVRTVPMPSWVFWALEEWAAAAGIDSGPVLRPVSKGGIVGSGPVSAQAVFETVTRHARLAGLGKVTPHDLRRTGSE
ncbi:MAG: tyrosine-type recombinase/integrase [Rhodospirillales bacterium]|nr:tyrosine-type recombinase/integrase [Rhodospirillales bacterium]